MKEIADILGVSKPTLFRFLKANSFHETFKKRNTNMYDETTTKAIIEKKTSCFVRPATTVTTLWATKEYKITRREYDQQQQLLLYEQQKNTKLLEENIENKRWWQWWK